MASAASETSGTGQADGGPTAASILADAPRLATRNHPLLIFGIMTASLLQILDATIANVALPHMQSALGASPDTVTWVLTSYIIASAVTMPITGWLAERIGSRRLFLISVVLFVGASMLCGMAQNVEQMVLFRAFQGIGGAFISPLAQTAMLDTTRTSRQPQIIALWGMGIMIGPIAGPILGAWLTETLNWRWVFFLNVPLGIVALLILLAELPSNPIRHRRFDLFGFSMIALALASLQMLLDRGNHVDWFSSVEIWIYLWLCLSAAWATVYHFTTSANPLFERRLFADINFVVSVIIMLVVGVVMFATMALLPPMLQQLFGFDVIDTGLVLAPRGVGVLISMQLAGYLLRKGIDPRGLVGVGFLLGAYSLHMMTEWSLGLDQWNVVTSGMMQGLGMGLVFIPVINAAFATLPPELRTDASSLLSLSRSIGASVGISVVVTVLSRSIQRNHEELGGLITPESSNAFDLSAIDRFQSISDTVLTYVDLEVSRQAAMIGYINDFELMRLMTLAALPLIFLMRPAKKPSAR